VALLAVVGRWRVRSTLVFPAILAEIPELGCPEPGAAASLGGLAPMTRQSGSWTGRAATRGGRAGLRRALHMAARSASRFNPDLKAVSDRLVDAGKPGRVARVVEIGGRRNLRVT
jgi:transposase